MIPSREKVPIQQTLSLVDEPAPSRITQQQLESYLWGAAVLLRGTIDAGDYKQFIFPLLFYKRLCDVHDEETATALAESGGDTDFAAFPENHRFQIPPEAHWRAIRAVAKDVGSALQAALRAIETANPEQLYGIFGDAQWTNKDRLSDALLRDLIEHFSSLNLTIANLPEDELGNGYEYLIKKFADDAGHTAAEFYTNRTVVHLMAELLQPQPGESIYDPTCGSGGMLLSAVAYLRWQGLEWRNLRLYGQERNLMTSSIARMNCFLHGIENFRIERGDTLSNPLFVEGDRLQQFNVVLANPPYSIKQWDRAAFAADPWGRNFLGTPPQGRADYAFFQHILRSLDPTTGRCAILFPHGVLFRQEEAAMRKRLIEADLVECVIGLGPNLFYNSAMEACVVICRTSKPTERQGKILLINAIDEVTRDKTQSFLTDEHIERIATAYSSFTDEYGFAKVVEPGEIQRNDYSLKIDLYVEGTASTNDSAEAVDTEVEFYKTLQEWNESRIQAQIALASLLPELGVAVSVSELATSLHASIPVLVDRSNWSRVRFGDVVKIMRETVDPSSGELDRYIAGEHMDSENVHLRRWGRVGNGYLGPAFIRRFRKGQVLYGSRRTYLKKVAYAEFDGITANTTFVLEAVTDKLYQPLLPWIMLSERFSEHSIRESKGSTNPYINWPDIAKFEFDLPPLEVQRRIAEVLWAVDEVRQKLNAVSMSIEGAYRNRVSNFFYAPIGDDTRNLFKQGWRTAQIEDLTVPDAPIRYGIVQVGQFCDDGIPTVAIRDLGGDFINRLHRTSQAIESRYVGSRVKPGDLLLSIKATIGEIALVPDHFEGNISRDLARIRCGPDIDPRILLHLFRSDRYRSYIDKHVVGSTRKEISIHRLRKFIVPLPPESETNEFLSLIADLELAKESVQNHVAYTVALNVNLINEITSEPS